MKPLFIALTILFYSCSYQDANPFNQNTDAQLVSIAYLRDLYQGSVVYIDQNIYIEGYLVSNDSGLNFYHTLVFEDTSGGIKLAVDLDDTYLYYTTFAPYRIYCQGLYLGGSSDNVKLGGYSGYYYVQDLDSELISSHISEISDSSLLMPDTPTLTLSEINDRYLSTYVILHDLALENTTLSDGTGYSIELEISTYSSFYGHELLSDDCLVMGIIDKSEGLYTITPNFDSDIMF